MRGSENLERHFVVHGGSVVGEDFSGRRFGRFSSDGTRFERCRFDGAVFESVGFGEGRRDSTYVDCTFDGARMRVGPVGIARFERCSFLNVRIREWLGHAVELVDCVFSGRIDGGWLSGSVPEEYWPDAGRTVNEIRGNDFSEAKLVDFAFRCGVDLRAQLLPTGQEYVYIDDLPLATRRVREAMLAEENLEFRRAAFAFIQVWEGLVAGGQRQQLLREKDYEPRQRAAFRRLVEIATDVS